MNREREGALNLLSTVLSAESVDFSLVNMHRFGVYVAVGGFRFPFCQGFR